MHIDPHGFSQADEGMKHPSQPHADPSLPSVADDVLYAWKKELSLVPNVREDKVARARIAIAQPDYPSPAILLHIAGLLSAHLRNSD